MRLNKTCLLLCVFLLICQLSFAVHIKGGLIRYEYIGPATPGNSNYLITVDVYRRCLGGGPNPTALNIYDATTFSKAITEISTPANLYTLLGDFSKTTYDPCITNIPATPLCYQIYRYSTTVTLPDNANGYIIAASDANRIAGIVNVPNSSGTGITFTATIPGVVKNVDFHVNSSPTFEFKDTALICYNAKFQYQFEALDKDGDHLTYSFGEGLNGTSASRPPPYTSIPYSSPYSGEFPLGSRVQIDSLTGLISGIAPAQNGEYVIAVYVHEWRGGILFNSTRKELQITVADCSLVAAYVRDYVNCENYTLRFENETLSSNIISYAWDFGVGNSNTDVSSDAQPVFTYADTGTYHLKLTVVNNTGCTDSTTATVKVYPGFKPDFSFVGSCVASPFLFTDKSFAKYGTINSWFWNMNDSSATAIDTFRTTNASLIYSGPQTTDVTLYVTSSVGCYGTFTKTITAFENVVIAHPFLDTLICSIDTLPLKAQASGTYQWTPHKNISNPFVLNPLVYPKDTTVYTLTVSDRGCTDSIKVQVNVLPFITVRIAADSGICRTDSFTLRPISEALSYRWRESVNANSLSNASIKNPVAKPLSSITYYVTGNLGYCQDSAKITINVAPYPTVNLGNDTLLCYGDRVQFNPSIKADLFTWTASSSLANTQALRAVAGPEKTAMYVLAVRDTSYCPKAVTDTIHVRVIPRFYVDAGKDTSATIGQPMQLAVTGGNPYTRYTWMPSDFLSSDTTSNPVATVTSMLIDSITYTVRVTSPEGCSATDNIVLHVFRSGPEIFVPTAFTPNGDGLNDVLRPILTGITEIEFFRIYNRWGQLLYATTNRDAGWDGTYKGKGQQSDTYIYMAQGKTFDGQAIFRKGTTVLIR